MSLWRSAERDGDLGRGCRAPPPVSNSPAPAVLHVASRVSGPACVCIGTTTLPKSVELAWHPETANVQPLTRFCSILGFMLMLFHNRNRSGTSRSLAAPSPTPTATATSRRTGWPSRSSSRAPPSSRSGRVVTALAAAAAVVDCPTRGARQVSRLYCSPLAIVCGVVGNGRLCGGGGWGMVQGSRPCRPYPVVPYCIAAVMD